MNTWTDEELGELLAETFHAHERAEDADDARRIARHVPALGRPRIWPAVVAVAASIVVLACGATYAVDRSAFHALTGGDGSTSAVAGGPMVPAADANRAAAQQEADRLVGWVRLPGARALAAPRSGPLAQPDPAPMTSSAAYQVHVTRFWVVPRATAAELAHQLAAAPPPIPGTPAATGATGTAEPGHPGKILHATADTVSWTADLSQTTKRYVSPQLDLVLVQDGPAVDVRADAWVTWRPAAPAGTHVVGPVTSVKVTYRPRVGTGPRDRHPSGVAVITDPAEIARLTTVVDSLPVRPPGGVYSCPMQSGTPAVATMVFRSAATVWTFRSVDSCVASVQVSTDGTQRAALEVGGFFAAVWSALSQAR